MLEELSPWEYQEIRKVLGHGSGFDSPGWRTLRAAMPRLGAAFHARRREAGLSLVDVYVERRDHDALYRLAESLVELDEWCQMWRVRHYRVVARVIGDSVVGTQGTPVEVLGRLVQTVFFPELWQVRNELTARSQAEARVTLREEVTGLLQELLRLDTVNPPGNETRAAELLTAYLAAERASGASWWPRRPSGRTWSRVCPAATGRACS